MMKRKLRAVGLSGAAVGGDEEDRWYGGWSRGSCQRATDVAFADGTGAAAGGEPWSSARVCQYHSSQRDTQCGEQRTKKKKPHLALSLSSAKFATPLGKSRSSRLLDLLSRSRDWATGVCIGVRSRREVRYIDTRRRAVMNVRRRIWKPLRGRSLEKKEVERCGDGDGDEGAGVAVELALLGMVWVCADRESFDNGFRCSSTFDAEYETGGEARHTRRLE
ncbi:hypothetical protein MRB53_041927 [Persea americana]|nr:hypothetical protein MRB53_041927 [Persea americana]